MTAPNSSSCADTIENSRCRVIHIHTSGDCTLAANSFNGYINPMWLYIHTHIHILKHTYMHTYIHTYIHAHIHSYIHILKHTYSSYIHTCLTLSNYRDMFNQYMKTPMLLPLSIPISFIRVVNAPGVEHRQAEAHLAETLCKTPRVLLDRCDAQCH
jgi:hypothetical protein